MLRLTTATLAIAALIPVLARSQTALPVKTLTEIKDATVFIRVEKDRVAAASGSAFLIRVDGETGYLITNHHVVHLTAKVVRKVPYVIPPEPIRPGQLPPIRLGPRVQYRTELREVAVPAPNITLVFSSGRKNERSVPAVVIASDADADLAVLKVTGVKNLPKPITLKSPELVETMSVFMFGYPFGKALSLDQGNPAITVGRGSVSSIRTTKSGEVGMVQLDGDVNPGNSGGPVVDEKGQLVGVVVAKITNTKIGMAIPTPAVQRMLAGRVGKARLLPAKAEKGMLDIDFEVDLIDPLGGLKELSLHYAPTSAVTDQAKKNRIATLAESKKIELKRETQRATGRISVALPEKGGIELTYQVAYVNGDGKPCLTEPKADRIPVPASPVAVRPPGPAPTPSPRPTPTPQPPVDEKFDAAAIEANLKPVKPDDRGVVVSPTLPSPKLKAMLPEEIALIIAELKIPERAAGAVGKLHQAEVDPKRQAEVARLLEKWAADAQWNVFARQSAIVALQTWGTKESVPVLAERLKDGGPSIHYKPHAMIALAHLGGDQAISAIASMLDDFFHAGHAVNLLTQIGSASEAKVVPLLASTSAGKRLNAAKVLKAVGTKQCAPALFKLLEQEKDANVRKVAQEALQAISARQAAK